MQMSHTGVAASGRNADNSSIAAHPYEERAPAFNLAMLIVDWPREAACFRASFVRLAPPASGCSGLVPKQYAVDVKTKPGLHGSTGIAPARQHLRWQLVQMLCGFALVVFGLI